MQQPQPNWLSRQVLLELQDDVPAFVLKTLFFGIVLSVLLVECGATIPIAASVTALSHFFLSCIASRINPNTPHDS